ncbi:MAG TPA: serine hydrolase domain-containing protein, partial [Chloroflexota bacterium]|nr:serine hydrolase domain-containing protein [Chloroflexota bacterium]
VTLRGLLSHSAGLPLDPPAEAAPYQLGLDWPTLARACRQTPLQRTPSTYVQYSNVGYGLLAATAERTTGQSFPDALGELVLRPLKIEGYLGTEPPRPPLRMAGVRGTHKGTPHETFNSPFWRSLAMPWAGLVTSARAPRGLVRAFLGTPQGFLRPETRSEATSNQAGDLAGGFGRPLIWEKSPHWAPAEAGPDSFGHSGASGCVAWASPSRGAAWIVLGTRVADSGWLLRQGAELGRMVLETL